MENKIIELRHVGMEWGNRVALSDVSLSVDRGDFVAITGPNGGGKTTLLRIILKLLRPSSGEVLYFSDGRPVDRLPIGYLPQKSQIDTRFPITVDEVIASGLLGLRNVGKEEQRSRVEDVLELTGLTSHRDQAIGNLSGGQLQRTLLGRTLISRPSVLVLDEPLSYVDKRFEHRIYEIVADLASKTTILLVSHEMSAIGDMANRHLIVDKTVTECHAAHHHVHVDCDDA